MEILAKLGIDWQSVIVYTVNFGLLVVIIAYYFTKPIMEMIDKRRKTISDNLDEAERIKVEFLEEKKKHDSEKEIMNAKMEQELAELKQEMDEKRRKQEEEIEQKKSKMLDEVQKIVTAEKNNILKNSQTQILELIEKIVLHVVSNKIPEATVKESVAETWNTFNKK